MPIPNDDDTGVIGTPTAPRIVISGVDVGSGPAPTNTVSGVTVDGPGVLPANPFGVGGTPLGFLQDQSFWFRVGIGAIGIALIIIGIVILFRRPIAAVAVPEAGALNAAANIVKGK